MFVSDSVHSNTDPVAVFLCGVTVGIAVATAIVVYLRPVALQQEGVAIVNAITFTIHHVKTTKNTEVYGPDPMDATTPLINSIYLQKNAVGTPVPASLQLVLTPVEE